MREIKFRAWDGKRINYNPIFSRDWVSDINTQLNERLREHGHVLMQFTGLLDKNGKEIYENDIVAIDQDLVEAFDLGYEKGVVKFFRGHFAVTKDGSCYSSLAALNVLADMVGRHFRGQVIGNIYENPDLLK